MSLKARTRLWTACMAALATAPAYAQVVVDPDGIGATDVVPNQGSGVSSWTLSSFERLYVGRDPVSNGAGFGVIDVDTGGTITTQYFNYLAFSEGSVAYLNIAGGLFNELNTRHGDIGDQRFSGRVGPGHAQRLPAQHERCW